MRISDWSSDVCSSDLYRQKLYITKKHFSGTGNLAFWKSDFARIGPFAGITVAEDMDWGRRARAAGMKLSYNPQMLVYHPARKSVAELESKWRSEEHTSELQSLMRISYAVFCLKKKKTQKTNIELV